MTASQATFLPVQITCICTVLDNTKSKEMSEIHANLRSSPHLLAVGTEDACCYLVHFGISTTDEYDATFTYAPFSTDICKHHKSDNKFKISDVYYFSKGSVFSIAYQQANDDPHPVIYLWFAHSAVKSGRSLSSRAHRPQIVLVRVDFPNDEKSDLLTTPFIQQPHLMWYPDKCSRWLSFRTIFQSDSFERSAIGCASSSSSTSLESRSPICEGLSRHTSGVDSTLLLMTWIDESTANAEGALFDLNAFYYKRLVQRVLFDSTIAHQNAFISRFTLANPKQIQFGLPLDVVANASSITRFGSVFSDTNDALFYPSTLTFSLNVITATHTYTISIHSIQEEVLNYAELHIDKVMNCRPNTVSEWISAVGLANANSTVSINSENAETSLVVSALIYHQRGRALKKWIETTSNINARNRLAKQLWDEVEYAKSRFDELSSPLFGSLSTDLSRPAIVSMGGIVSLLTITKTLFASIATKTDAVNDAEKAEFECHHRASSNLALYSQLVLFLWKRQLLPEMNGFRRVREQMQKNYERCDAVARQNGETLWIDSLLSEMQSVSSDEAFWMSDESTPWYPPRSILPNGQPKDEQWKTECDRWTTRVMAMLPYKSDIQLPQAVLDKWQENVTSKMANYHLRRSLAMTETDRKRLSLHSAVIDSRVFPNRKRISTENTSADLNAPEVSRRRLNRDGNENSPVLDDRAARLEEALPEEEMESIRRVLQTPPSRRRMMLSNRAVFGDSPMTSPIASSLSVPAPTSILKSNRRKDVINPDNEQGSEPRPRLRFHLPSSHTNSSTDSPLSESNLIQSSEMKQAIPQQPDFNYESDDDEEEEHELEDSVIVLEDEDSKKVLADIVHPTADDSMGIVAEGTEAVVMSEENSSIKNRSYEEQSDESGDENEERESEKVESKERKDEEIPEETGDDSNDSDRAKRILSVINSGFDMQDDSLNSMKISQSERQPISTTNQKIVYYEEQEWEDDIEMDDGENRLIEQKSPVETTQQQSSSGEDSIISRSFEEQAEEDVVDEEEEGEDRSKKDTLKKCADNDDMAPSSKAKHDDIAEPAMNVDVDDQSNLDYHHAVTYQVIEENTECDSAKQQSFEEQQWACAQVIDDLDHMQYTETATVTVSTIQREQTYESRVGAIEEQHEEEDDMRQESDKGQQAASQSQLIVIETTQRHQQFSDAIPDEDRKRIEELRKMAMQLEQKKHKRPIDSQSHGAVLLETRRDEQGPKNTADMASSSLAKSNVVDQSEQSSLSKSVQSVSKTDVVEAATIESTGVSEQVEPQRDLLEVRPAASTRKIARGASEKPPSPPSHRRTSRRRTHSENQSIVSLSSSPVRTPVKKSTRSRGGVSTELERTKEMPELNEERNAFEAEITPPAMQMDTETTEPVTPTRRRTTRASSQDKSGNATHLTTESMSKSTRRRLQLTSSTDDSESAALSERAVSPSRSRKRSNSKSQSQDVEQSAMMSASDTPTSRSSSRLSRRSSVSRNTSPARALTDLESGEPTTPTRRRKRASSNQSSQEVDEAQIEQSSTASGRRTRASAKVVESQVDEPVTPTRRSTRASSSVSRDNRSSSPATSSIQHRSPSRRSSRSSSIASISRSSVSEDTMSVTSQKRGRRSTHSPAKRRTTPRKRVSKNTRAENSVSPARSPAAKSRRATSLTIPSSPSTSSSSSSAAISKTPTKTTRSSKKGRRRSASESVAAAAESKAPKTRKIQIRAGRKTIAEIEEERNARTHTLRMTPTRLKKIFDE
ncbi:unnamed protein product [Anisakis simplex]|uniref:ELYS-bb domain-containing protein n=1 Tax=Anisakis simplex TaxID=6269 RepID=A0A158PPE7_ANISI|nr:unnamed protein product [Anisakis simplex]